MKASKLSILAVMSVASLVHAAQPLVQPPLCGRVIDQQGKAVSSAALQIVNRATVTTSTAGIDGRFSITVSDRTPGNYG